MEHSHHEPHSHAKAHACCAHPPRATVAVPQASSQDIEFTCPMHPEVVQKGPGACPICGMALEPKHPHAGDEDTTELDDMSRRFWISTALTLPVVAVSMIEMVAPSIMHALTSPRVLAWVQAGLTTPVVLWGAAPFFARGWASLRTRNLNMFTLIALGTGVAFAFSWLALLVPSLLPKAFLTHAGLPPLYFEAAATITALVLLGQVLELRARGQVSGALRALLKRTPKMVRRVDAQGNELDIPVEHVAVGDMLRVRAGENVPVDGEVFEGMSQVDESMMTGEPIPVEKKKGDLLSAGTINGHGALIMIAKRVGQDTLLAQIVRMVSEAQRSRAPIQRLADTISGYFVPVVVLVSIVTFVVWSMLGPEPRLAYGLVNAVAVLIIACPCALGLATPMSIMVGTTRGALEGILVKNAEALETFERIDTLVFDKTGTLTEGKPALSTVETLGATPASEVLALAASLQRGSEHVLARALVSAAERDQLTLSSATNITTVPGKGLSGQVGGHEVAVGNAALMNELNVNLDALASKAEALRMQGQTLMYVSVDRQASALIGVSDAIKTSAKSALAALKGQGVKRVVLLTGDHRAAAEHVARALGVDEVYADVLPTDKHAVIAKLKAQGHLVAMVGDGINDAAALAAADVGIAMGSGTDVAIASAGITLMHGDLSALTRARSLSIQTMRNIRQNLMFAFIYNALGVPIAAGALYPVFGLLLSPMLAAAAMSFSSVSVIANALRMRSLKI